MSKEPDNEDFLPGIKGIQLPDNTGANEDAARHTLKYKLLLTFAIALLFGSLGYLIYMMAEVVAPPEVPEDVSAEAAMPYFPPPTAGSTEAKVKAVLVLPSVSAICQKEACEMLVAIARKHPKKLRVEFYDMIEGKGAEILKEKKLECSTLFINGEYCFECPDGKGKSRKIMMTGTPGGKYDLRDVIAVLKQKMKEAYGEAPSDLDSFVSEEALKRQKEQAKKKAATKASTP